MGPSPRGQPVKASSSSLPLPSPPPFSLSHPGRGTPVDRHPQSGISVSQELVFSLPTCLFESPFPLGSAETTAQGCETERARLNCTLLSGTCLQWLLIKKKKVKYQIFPNMLKKKSVPFFFFFFFFVILTWWSGHSRWEKEMPPNFTSERSDSLFSGNCRGSSLFLIPPVTFLSLALLAVKGKAFPLQRYWIACSSFLW